MSTPIPKNLSSAYSDDGRLKKRIANQNVEIENPIPNLRPPRLEGEEMLISVQAEAELSVNLQRDETHQQRPDEEAISERPDEAEEASSPPGTIGDRDIMSEHIQTNLKYKKGKVYNSAWMDDGVSEEAHKSTVTKISKVAEVSPAIALQDTTRSIVNFSVTIDRI